MIEQASVADFDGLSWHDNTIYDFRFEVGDPDQGDWHSDLVLDIDHIVEWIWGIDGGALFRVAPATLTFHDVTNLGIAIDLGNNGSQTVLHEASIHGITRERIRDRKILLDRPYYRWWIEINWPMGGEFAFGANGFTQTLRAEPVLLDRQKFSPAKRA